MSEDNEKRIDEAKNIERFKAGRDFVDMVGGGWNYRVIRRQSECEERVAIHEVYYGNDGVPRSCTENPVAPAGETVEDLKKDIEMMKQAFDKSILEYEDF